MLMSLRSAVLDQKRNKSGNCRRRQAGTSQNLAMNESAIRDVGGDTSQKYSAKRRSADNQKEADITAQLNQKASQMASSNSQADSR